MTSESHPARRHRVVVGYDGSDVAGAAVAWAGERVGPGGKLVVVYSRPPSDPVDEPALRATLEVHAGPALRRWSGSWSFPRATRHVNLPRWRARTTPTSSSWD